MFEAIIETLVPSPLQTIYLAITAFIIGAAIGVDEKTNNVQAIVSIIKMLILVIIGGLVYVTLEIMYRGYSHWTMFIVGGICFRDKTCTGSILYSVSRKQKLLMCLANDIATGVIPIVIVALSFVLSK